MMMRHGTELEILKAEWQDDGTVAVELVGIRCFQLVGDPWLQELGLDEEPTPAPLSTVAAATEDSGKFIIARIEYAADAGQEGSVPLVSDAMVEMSPESEKILNDLVGEADEQANIQISAGSNLSAIDS